MSDATAIKSSTWQRMQIRQLLARSELSTRRYTLMHRIPFRAARLPDPPDGGDIEPHLESMSLVDAGRLIDALRRELDDGDDDD
jgi:hypothetical protein